MARRPIFQALAMALISRGQSERFRAGLERAEAEKVKETE